MNIQSSFTVYTAALHALILNPLLFAYYWLGLSWSDLEWLYFIKTKLFISKNKQQETLHQQQAAGEAKHSAENTTNLSGAALRVAIEAGQTKGLILRHPPLRNELQGPQVALNSLTADLTPTCHSISLTAPTIVPLSLLKAVGYLAAWCVVIAECQPWEATHIMYIATDEQKRNT